MIAQSIIFAIKSKLGYLAKVVKSTLARGDLISSILNSPLATALATSDVSSSVPNCEATSPHHTASKSCPAENCQTRQILVPRDQPRLAGNLLEELKNRSARSSRAAMLLQGFYGQDLAGVHHGPRRQRNADRDGGALLEMQTRMMWTLARHIPRAVRGAHRWLLLREKSVRKIWRTVCRWSAVMLASSV